MTPTTMSQLWRRRRHLGLALMTCALTLGAYILWTSTSGHVVERRLDDFRQSRVDRAIRHQLGLSHNNDRHLSEPNLKRKSKNDQLHDMNKQASFQTLSLVGNSASSTSKHMSVSDDNFQLNRIMVSRPIQLERPVTQKHMEHNGTTGEKHIYQIPSDTADDSNFSSQKNRRRKNRWKLEDSHAAEPDLLPDKYSNRSESQPHTSATSTKISHSVAEKEKNEMNPKPLYLVVPMHEKVTESVFKEPEIVIRSEDADMPSYRRVLNNASAVSSEYGPGGGKRSPLLGSLHGGPGNCRVYSARDDLPELVDFAAGVDCLDLATTPTVVVCPYPSTDDRHLSQPLRTHGVWEPHIVQLFQAALLTDNEFGVYDVGANIGQYALLAAAMGRRVVAVELHRPSIYRLHKAIKLGRLENKVYATDIVDDESLY